MNSYCAEGAEIQGGLDTSSTVLDPIIKKRSTRVTSNEKTFRDFTEVYKKKSASTEALNSAGADVQYSMMRRNNQQTSLLMLQKIEVLQSQIDRAEDLANFNRDQPSNSWLFATKMLKELHMEYERKNRAESELTVMRTPVNSNSANKESKDNDTSIRRDREQEQSAVSRRPSARAVVGVGAASGVGDRTNLSDNWRRGEIVDLHYFRSDEGQSSVCRGSRAGGLTDSWRSADRNDQHTSSSDQGQSSVSRGSRVAV